ncbi:hypothetical protein AB0O76_29240 [Streptomyces sp. NPDC086554]
MAELRKNLPGGTESGQPWSRRRDLYLVHDMAAQWAVLRDKLVKEACPNG